MRGDKKPEPDDGKVWDRGRYTTPNADLLRIIASLLTDEMDGSVMDVDDDQSMSRTSRTELDSNANMPVVGRNAFVIARTEETADVSAFTPDYKPMKCSIVDAALLYDCPYSGDEVILLIRNAIHVPNMENNLIPPFIMREAGVIVDDTPKIQTTDPTISSHSIYFEETGLRIPLSLKAEGCILLLSNRCAEPSSIAENRECISLDANGMGPSLRQLCDE